MRYAVIDFLDTICYESDDLEEVEDFYFDFPEFMRGVYDYVEHKYIHYSGDTLTI